MRLSSLVAMGILAASRLIASSDGQAPTPEQEYKTLLRQYNDAFSEYTKAFSEANLPADRERVIREKYPMPNQWDSKFLALAEKNPNEPFAEDALIWILTGDARLKRFLPWHEHTARYEMIWITQARVALLAGQQE